MTWECRLSNDAEKDFRRLPAERKQQLGQAIDEMSRNPFLGDVRRIRGGRFQGALRKRVGRYRIVYAVDSDARIVSIAAILVRSEKTYR